MCCEWGPKKTKKDQKKKKKKKESEKEYVCLCVYRIIPLLWKLTQHCKLTLLQFQKTQLKKKKKKNGVKFPSEAEGRKQKRRLKRHLPHDS